MSAAVLPRTAPSADVGTPRQALLLGEVDADGEWRPGHARVLRLVPADGASPLVDAPAPSVRRSTRPARRPQSRRAGARGPRYRYRPTSASAAGLRRTATPEQWRLTERGHALLRGVTVTTTLVVAGLVLAAGMLTVVRAVSGPPATATQAVTVRPGQTLWQIAGRAQPGANLSETVMRIRALNHLQSSTLQPGQVLLVPSGH